MQKHELVRNKMRQKVNLRCPHWRYGLKDTHYLHRKLAWKCYGNLTEINLLKYIFFFLGENRHYTQHR